MRILQCVVFGLALALAAPACGGGSGGNSSGGGSGSEGDSTETGDDAESGPTTEDGETCTPACDDLDCGDDGCGGSCGDCAGDDTCEAGVCTPPAACVPDCDGKTCGDDGCSGSCGTCTAPATCINSACCTPDCGDSTCGNNDGCGGSCGACEADQQCNAGVCEEKTYTCAELFGFAQATDCDWSADHAGCEASITDTYTARDETESASLTALLTCLDDENCGITKGKAQVSCQKEHCLAQSASCEASQYGELMCFEITQCLAEPTCPKDIISGEPTAACRRQCLEQGTEVAIAFWLNLELCGLSNCLDEADFDQCMIDTSKGQLCTTEYSNCYDEAQQ